MFHSKLLTSRLGATNVISSVNRLQLAIEAKSNGSIMNAAAAATASSSYCPHRYQHVMTTIEPKRFNNFTISARYARQFSIQTIKQACVSISVVKIWKRKMSRWIKKILYTVIICVIPSKVSKLKKKTSVVWFLTMPKEYTLKPSACHIIENISFKINPIFAVKSTNFVYCVFWKEKKWDSL